MMVDLLLRIVCAIGMGLLVYVGASRIKQLEVHHTLVRDLAGLVAGVGLTAIAATVAVSQGRNLMGDGFRVGVLVAVCCAAGRIYRERGSKA